MRPPSILRAIMPAIRNADPSARSRTGGTHWHTGIIACVLISLISRAAATPTLRAYQSALRAAGIRRDRSWTVLSASLAGAVLLILAAGAPALAQAQVDSREGIALRNEIYQLRQQVQQLQDQVARGGGSGGRSSYSAPSSSGNDMVAQLLTRVDALEEQVRQLRGRIDETQNTLQRQGADLGKRIDDLAFQVNPQAAGGVSGGNPGGAPPNQGAPPAPPRQAAAGQAPPLRAPTPTPPVHRTPELTMQEGSAALARHDYPGAEQAAREVLANRTSPRAYDAQLLLGQALEGQKQYAQAAIAFDDAYNRSRKGSHAQDALVGLASSLTAINEKRAACDTLNRLHQEFPQPRADLRQQVAATSQRAGCR